MVLANHQNQLTQPHNYSIQPLTNTLTLKHIGIGCLWGLSIGILYFILQKPLILWCYGLTLALTSTLIEKQTNLNVKKPCWVWFWSILNYEDTRNVLINHHNRVQLGHSHMITLKSVLANHQNQHTHTKLQHSATHKYTPAHTHIQTHISSLKHIVVGGLLGLFIGVLYFILQNQLILWCYGLTLALTSTLIRYPCQNVNVKRPC